MISSPLIDADPTTTILNPMRNIRQKTSLTGISILQDRNDAALANQTLDNAHNASPEATPLVHSDRGFAYTRQIYRSKLEGYGMSQSMSRVSKCIDNGVCEGFQGQFKDILFIMYPNITSKEEMIQAINGTLDYYIHYYPQKRLNGKTCGQVRKESLEQNEYAQYPIVPAARYVRYWNEIERKQKHQKEMIIDITFKGSEVNAVLLDLGIIQTVITETVTISFFVR